MPECIEYVNKIRRKSFAASLKKQRQAWLDTQLRNGEKMVLKKELLQDVLVFIVNEYIDQEFDRLWDIARRNEISYHIVTKMRNSFRRLKQLKGFVINEYVHNPANKHPEYDIWVEKTATIMKDCGMKIEISEKFMMKQMDKYKELALSLNIVNDDGW